MEGIIKISSAMLTPLPAFIAGTRLAQFFAKIRWGFFSLPPRSLSRANAQFAKSSATRKSWHFAKKMYGEKDGGAAAA